MSSTPETPKDPLEDFNFQFKVDPDYLQMAVNNKKIYEAHLEAGFDSFHAFELTKVLVEQLMLGINMQRTMEDGDGA